MNCVVNAWNAHERELRGWLQRRLGNPTDAEDMLQDLFLKAMRQGKGFCDIRNPRAWLFEVARNALADRLRVARETVPLPDSLASPLAETEPVDGLATCLPSALAALSPEDREALTLCDLDGMPQEKFAQHLGLSLPAAKSRVQRARKRLRAQLTTACRVQFDDAGHVCGFAPQAQDPSPARAGCIPAAPSASS